MNSALKRTVVWTVAFGALMVCAEAIAATMVAQDRGGNVVRLFDRVCKTQAILDKLNAGIRDRFQDASFIYQGRDLKACWAGGPDGLIYVVDEEGDVTRIPPHVFKPEIEG